MAIINKLRTELISIPICFFTGARYLIKMFAFKVINKINYSLT